MLSSGVPQPIALASTFCVPSTSNATVNAALTVPGGGAATLTGTITLVP